MTHEPISEPTFPRIGLVSRRTRNPEEALSADERVRRAALRVAELKTELADAQAECAALRAQVAVQNALSERVQAIDSQGTAYERVDSLTVWDGGISTNTSDLAQPLFIGDFFAWYTSEESSTGEWQCAMAPAFYDGKCVFFERRNYNPALGYSFEGRDERILSVADGVKLLAESGLLAQIWE